MRKRVAQKKNVALTTEPLAAFKGFDADMKCRGYHEVGEIYVHDGLRRKR